MPRYGIGVGFDFDADDDDHAQQVVDEVIALIKEHPYVSPFGVSQIEGAPECQYDCPEEDEDDLWDDEVDL